MPGRDLQIGQIVTKDQLKRLTRKLLALLPALFVMIAGIDLSYIRYEDTGRLTAFGWIILAAIMGVGMSGFLWWYGG